jgi:hypothetical protein
VRITEIDHESFSSRIVKYMFPDTFETIHDLFL